MPYYKAVKDEATGNYYTDSDKKAMLNEVIVDIEGTVYAVESTGVVLRSPVDNIT